MYKQRLLAVLFVLVLSTVSLASWPPAGVPSGTMPWERPNFQGYGERNVTWAVPAGVVPATPQLYALRVERFAAKHTRDNPNTVVLMAHVPEHARVFIQDEPTITTGDMRFFESPPLSPGHTFRYRVRVDWMEKGRPVSQAQTLAVKPGEVYCVYVEKAQSPGEAQAKVEANVAKLSSEDQKRARAQKYCAVQTGKLLGSMGVPAKITVKGQPVFLCCEGCKDEALAHADQTLAKVKELTAKNK